RKQAEELVAKRLVTYKSPPELTVHFEKTGFLEALFKARSEIGIRQFLNESSKQWRELTGKVKAQISLDELYQKKQEEIKAQPKRLAYSQDYFFWLAGDVGEKIPGVTVEKFTGGKDHYTFRWLTDGEVIIFGKESGSNYKRWEAIATEALNQFKADSRGKIVMFRTKELAQIPGEKWKNKEIIEEAQRNCLQIMRLDNEELTDLYAARDLYLDAKEGNIIFNPDEILNFVSGRLNPLIDRILAPMSSPSSGSGPEPLVKLTPESPSQSFMTKIKQILKKDLFLSFKLLFLK
ncbi:MAG: hypothetical protein HQK55_04355, partial [Deltaproteobacteria bacterium]|nr:hypothetical protein [Deltaproteobacteria bacterium]